MANFYTDNDDIRFLFRHYNLKTLAEIMEGDFAAGVECEWAPADADEAIENYDKVLEFLRQDLWFH